MKRPYVKVDYAFLSEEARLALIAAARAVKAGCERTHEWRAARIPYTTDGVKRMETLVKRTRANVRRCERLIKQLGGEV